MPSKPPPDNRKTSGRIGEDAAAQFLAASGYRIVGRNVRPLPGLARGEIDLVGWDGDVLCFIEVKARTSVRGPQPEISVSPAKRGQLARLAEAYMSLHQIEPDSCRFDVVSVWIDPALPSPMLTLQKNAFDAG